MAIVAPSDAYWLGSQLTSLGRARSVSLFGALFPIA